jgi:hypothetical protein
MPSTRHENRRATFAAQDIIFAITVRDRFTVCRTAR